MSPRVPRACLCAILACLIGACGDDDSSPTKTTITQVPAPVAPAPAPAPAPIPPPVGNRPPAPSFKVTPFPPEGDAPFVVNFNLCPTADPDGDLIRFTFDFGDGEVLLGPPCRFRHVYAAGRYRANMCVEDLRNARVCVEYFVKVR